MNVHCIYAKNSLSTLHKSKVYILLLGALHLVPTGALPQTPLDWISVLQIPEIWTSPATNTQLRPCFWDHPVSRYDGCVFTFQRTQSGE